MKSLIVMIIILASAAVSSFVGNAGILKRAEQSKQKYGILAEQNTIGNTNSNTSSKVATPENPIYKEMVQNAMNAVITEALVNSSNVDSFMLDSTSENRGSKLFDKEFKSQAGSNAKGEITYSSYSTKTYRGTITIDGTSYDFEYNAGVVTLIAK